MKTLLPILASLFLSACATAATTPINNPVLTGTLVLNQSSTSGTAIIPPANLGSGSPTSSTVLFGNGGWGAIPSNVGSLTGTANEVLVNGGTGPATGNVTLATPQDIGTSSSPHFSNITTSGEAIFGNLQIYSVFGYDVNLNTAQSGVGNPAGFHFIVNTGSAYLTALSLLSNGNTSVGYNLAVAGNETVTGTLGVTAATTLSGTLGVTGAATLSSTLGVTGTTTLGTANVTTLNPTSVVGGTFTSGTWNGNAIGAAYLPTATNSAFGIVKPDGTTITISGGVISAVGGGGGGGNVSTSGTITSGYTAQWNGSTSIAAVANTGTGTYVLSGSPTIASPTMTGTATTAVLDAPAIYQTNSGVLLGGSASFHGNVVADYFTAAYDSLLVSPAADIGGMIRSTNNNYVSSGVGTELYYDTLNDAGHIRAKAEAAVPVLFKPLYIDGAGVYINSDTTNSNLNTYLGSATSSGSTVTAYNTLDVTSSAGNAVVSIGNPSGAGTGALDVLYINGACSGTYSPKIVFGNAIGPVGQLGLDNYFGGTSQDVSLSSASGAVNLYANNAKIVAVTTSGASVAGNVSATAAVSGATGGFSGAVTVGSLVSGGAVSGTSATFTLPVDISAGTAGQIKFPTTQNTSADPRTLDDYVKGDFTPSFSGSGWTNTGSVTLAGHYMKVGHLVHVVILISSASSGSCQNSGGYIGNLPVSAAYQESGSWIAVGASNGGLYLTGTSVFPTNWSPVSVTSAGNPIVLSADYIQ